MIANDLVQIKGKVQTIENVHKTGRYNKPKILIQFTNKPYKLRISGSSYKSVNTNKLLRDIQPGDKIEIDTRNKEVKRSEKESIINSIFDWRCQPQIYGIRKNQLNYLTLNQYNNANKKSNANNFLWGIILVVFIMVHLIWIISKEDNKSKT